MKLPKSQVQILRVLSDGRLHTYRDIVLATGKYSNLPAELRERHPRSLGSKGLVREVEADVQGTKVAAFQITHLGCRLLGIDMPALVRDDKQAHVELIQRYLAWREEYKQEETEAERIGLRRNAYCLLKAMGDGQAKTLADLARATGIFSSLVQDLRSRHARHGSLASKGLIVESYEEHDDPERIRPIYTFRITKAGLKALEKAKG